MCACGVCVEVCACGDCVEISAQLLSRKSTKMLTTTLQLEVESLECLYLRASCHLHLELLVTMHHSG